VNLKSCVARTVIFRVLMFPWLFIFAIYSADAQQVELLSNSPAANLPSDLFLEDDLDQISALESVELLLDQIQTIEAEKNSFAPELGELSFDLGVQLENLGLHDEALEAFQRADQNMKVREGLYSRNREIVIRKIFEQHVELNDWESAEIALDSNAWLRARNVDANSLEYVEVLQDLVRWNLARDHYGVEEEESRSLVRAYSDLEKIFDIYEARDMPLDDQSLDLAMTVNHLLSMQYLILDSITQREGTAALDRQYIRQARTAASACQGFYEEVEIQSRCANSAERQIRQSQPETVYIDYSAGQFDQSVSFYSRSYFRGKEILLDQIEILRRDNDDSRTLDALLKLGDWYLLFGYQRSAEEVYAAAWEYASGIGLGDSVHMQEPQAISTAGLVESLPRLVVGNRRGEAELAVTIARNGEIEKIEYLDTDITEESAIADLSATIAASRYRPILREGVPIAAVAYTVSRQVSY